MLFKDFEGTNELYLRTLKEFCTQKQMDPAQQTRRVQREGFFF